MNTNVIIVWAGARHGCSGHRVLSEHESYHGVDMGALVTVCSRNTWFGHGCSGHRMLSEHECYYGLGMGALARVGDAEARQRKDKIAESRSATTEIEGMNE